MSYRISITGKDSYILIELFGEISIRKIAALNNYLYSDPHFIDHPYAIWDFTECSIDIEMSKVVEFAQQIVNTRHFDTPGKTAFVLDDPEAIASTTPFIQLVGEMPFQLSGFPTRVAAVKWITIEENQIVL